MNLCLTEVIPIHLSQLSQSLTTTSQLTKRCSTDSSCLIQSEHNLNPIITPLLVRFTLIGSLSINILHIHTRAVGFSFTLQRYRKILLLTLHQLSVALSTRYSNLTDYLNESSSSQIQLSTSPLLHCTEFSNSKRWLQIFFFHSNILLLHVRFHLKVAPLTICTQSPTSLITISLHIDRENNLGNFSLSVWE